MTFLSVTFLAGLLFAAGPIAIHLLHRRRQQTIPWAAMQFLVEAVGRRQWWRLRDWILMLLRASIIALFVLAMARPVVYWPRAVQAIDQLASLVGSSANGISRTGSDVIIIIDTSMSTSRLQPDGQPLLNHISNRLLDIANELGERDLLRVMESGPANAGRWLWPGARQVDEQAIVDLRKTLDNLKPTHAEADLAAAIQLAAEAPAVDDTRQRIILVITDNQAHSWQTIAPETWPSIKLALQENNQNALTLIIDNDAPTAENLALGPITTTRPILMPHGLNTLSTTITNFSATTSNPTVVRWKIDNQPLGLSSIPAIAPGQNVTVDLTTPVNLPSAESRQATITCTLDHPDSITLDNQSEAILPAAQSLDILIVDDSPDHRHTQFLAAAVGHHPSRHWPSPFKLTTITSDQLTNHPLSPYRAVVLTGRMNLPPETLARLKHHTKTGAGLWLIASPETRQAAFNDSFFTTTGNDTFAPSPAALGPVITNPSDDAYQPVTMTTLNHPAMATINNYHAMDLNQAGLYQYRNLLTSEQSDHSPGTVLLTTSTTQQPLVVASEFNRSRIIVQSFGLSLDDGNLPLWQGFVVLANEWLWWLASAGVDQFSANPGNPLHWHNMTPGDQSPIQITSPQGRIFAVTATSDHQITFTKTHQPGRYTVQSDTSHPLSLSIHRSIAESNLQPITQQQIDRIADQSSLEIIRDHHQPILAQYRQSRNLWPTLLPATLLIMILELTLAGILTRRTHTGKHQPSP